jgi:serine/threonine protein kinase
MKLHINKKYEEYSDAIRAMLNGERKNEQVFCCNRNTVERFTVDGKEFVVKRYKRPTWLNRFVYTFLRKSKAERSYLYAEQLLAAGFETPAPVAYGARRRFGLFDIGYFVSEYDPHPSLDIVYAESDEAERKALHSDFIAFTLRLHAKGIVHHDFNPRNIMVRRDASGYHFSLIDNNRMSFGRVPDAREAMGEFDQLGTDVRGLLQIIPDYVEARGFDLDECVYYSLKRRRHNLAKQEMKRKLRGK